MPADLADLRARLSAATPNDTVRGLIFNGTFSVIRARLGVDGARRCDPAGQGQRTAFKSYPVSEYLELVFGAVERLEEHFGDPDAVFYAFGHGALVSVFSSSVLGTTLKMLAGGRPAQLLANGPTGYLATVSYGTRTVEVVGERHVRLVFRRDFLVPTFHCGVLSAGVESVGGRDVRVRGRQTGFLDAIYDVEWQE